MQNNVFRPKATQNNALTEEIRIFDSVSRQPANLGSTQNASTKFWNTFGGNKQKQEPKVKSLPRQAASQMSLPPDTSLVSPGSSQQPFFPQDRVPQNSEVVRNEHSTLVQDVVSNSKQQFPSAQEHSDNKPASNPGELLLKRLQAGNQSKMAGVGSERPPSIPNTTLNWAPPPKHPPQSSQQRSVQPGHVNKMRYNIFKVSRSATPFSSLETLVVDQTCRLAFVRMT